MKCKIEDCDRDTAYQTQRVCQKHYFRFMRNGTYNLKHSRVALKRDPDKYRHSNPAGYQLVYEPDHPLCQKGGYVYEHRFVYYNQISKTVDKCNLCSDPVTWGSCHIDHIDEDVTNNRKENLRCLCRGCNVFRGHTSTSMGKYFLQIEGKIMSASAWARQLDVKVSCGTILRRKREGMTDYDAVYSKRLTHGSTKTKKTKAKYDKERGIGCITKIN